MYKHVFGPVPSRRLGVSLGVDLVKPKSCNMNCVFCECGATPKLSTKRESFKDIKEVDEGVKICFKRYNTRLYNFLWKWRTNFNKSWKNSKMDKK